MLEKGRDFVIRKSTPGTTPSLCSVCVEGMVLFHLCGWEMYISLYFFFKMVENRMKLQILSK